MSQRRLRMRPGAHVELFEQNGNGTSTLVHSSRPDEFLAGPCNACGHPLGFTEPVVINRDGHAHQRCVERGRHGRR